MLATITISISGFRVGVSAGSNCQERKKRGRIVMIRPLFLSSSTVALSDDVADQKASASANKEAENCAGHFLKNCERIPKRLPLSTWRTAFFPKPIAVFPMINFLRCGVQPCQVRDRGMAVEDWRREIIGHYSAPSGENISCTGGICNLAAACCVDPQGSFARQRIAGHNQNVLIAVFRLVLALRVSRPLVERALCR